MATHHPGAGDAGGDDASATTPGSPTNYKRASRKGAPRRFTCPYPGCDKVYSRAEHLQRHQLNHNPKEIYQCDVSGCDQKFVRLDLLARHKKRHSSSYIPRNRVPNFSTAPSGNQPASPSLTSPTGLPTPSPSLHQQPPPQQQHPQHHRPHHSPPLPQQHHHHYHQSYPQHAPRGPYNSSVLLTPSSDPSPQQATLPHPGPPRPPHPSSWAPAPINNMAMDMLHHKQDYYSRDAPLPGPTSMMAYRALPDDQMAHGSFATWLFDPANNLGDFSTVANMPFLDGGLESAFNNDLQYDYESLASRSQPDPTPPRTLEGPDDLLSEPRRREVLTMFQLFREKSDRYEHHIANIVAGGPDFPSLDLDMLRDCVAEYWDSVSPRLPIIHQPTFSANRCPVLLLVVMVALGAASLRSRDGGGSLLDYGAFADVIVEGARWAISMDGASTPPVALWSAQALLLVEFYEKLYSSRHLHERAHIYHTALLNNLRRGSPLIGRAGSESPPEEAAPGDEALGALDSRTWWIRWAESESMHRVVFAAFMLDILHAGMFGHAADMAPHEIRLPLPCDDTLWTANTPEGCRQLDASLRMYGVKQVSFLDGLKSALHGKEVKTHSFARMIIMSGLLSVAWHLSHRETHLKWLDARAPDPGAQEGWRKMLLRAFDVWKASFDAAKGEGAANGPIHSAAVLYHLAHICLHVDIVDCQVYAGARHLLGRKVSSRDYTNAVGRMRLWAKQSATRHAVLHAFKLLRRILADPRRRSPDGSYDMAGLYAIRSDPDPHCPWIMYYAALSIWSFVRALNPSPPPVAPPRERGDAAEGYRRAAAYVATGAALEELGVGEAAGLYDGLADLLDAMRGILGEASSDILREAHARLETCKDMLAGST